LKPRKAGLMPQGEKRLAAKGKASKPPAKKAAAKKTGGDKGKKKK